MSAKCCSGCKGENDRHPQRHCSECHRLYQAEWRGEKAIERNAIVQAVNRDRRIKNKYNLSPEETEAMLRSQGNACAVCITEFGEESIKMPRVDHDHSTGNVRGLLCHNCNLAIGLMEDQPRFFDRAAQYLRSRSSVSVSVAQKPKIRSMAEILNRPKPLNPGKSL